MGFNRFYLIVILNCFLILGASFLCVYFLNGRNQPSTAAGFGLLALLLTFRMIYHVNRTNRILGNFLSFMQDEDPSLSYTVKYTDRNFRGLNARLEDLITEFKANRIELEVQARYLETILENVSTGILSFNDAGEVRGMNKSASSLLGTGTLRHISELDKKIPGFGKRLMELQPWELLTEKITRRGASTHLSVSDARIKLKGEEVRIISLNDITSQMEEQEIESWKKLIRVINHEIMNSMTPITTLTLAIRKKLSRGQEVKPPSAQKLEDLEDAVQSAGIIEERSKGLVDFINRYKKMTSLPTVKPSNLPVADLFMRIEHLLSGDLDKRGIRLNIDRECTDTIKADPHLIEQVLINLIKNAVEALTESDKPEIGLMCRQDHTGSLCIEVIDNGEGIPADKLEQAFVPFFSTREEGSGIGLSLCRQIMRLHDGQISISSEPGKGTRVSLSF